MLPRTTRHLKRHPKVYAAVLATLPLCLLFLLGYQTPDKERKSLFLGLAVGSIVGALPSFLINLVSSETTKAAEKQALQDANDRKRKAYDESINKSKSALITSLESNADCYELEGDCRSLTISARKVKFFLVPPRHFRDEIQQLDPRIEFHGPNIFGSTLTELAEKTKINNFVDLIERHRVSAAETLLKRRKQSNQALYNNKKFGIFSLSFSRVGPQEKPRVNLCVYETDYFTHMVMRSAYRELKKVRHEIAHIAASDVGTEDSPYQCFLTSLGVNAFVLINGETLLVLTRRSKNGINAETDEKWHISMNEGLSITDDDGLGGPSLDRCLERGLKEELGILNKSEWAGKFLEFWLWREAFEVGLSALVKVNFTLDIFEARARVALDAARERAPGTAEKEFHYVEYTDAGLTKAKQELDLTEAARFTLSNLLAMSCPKPF